MKLTREEAIRKHREMWNWIAGETEKQKRCMDKWEYFTSHGITEENLPNMQCFCCEYTKSEPCGKCPVIWGDTLLAACSDPYGEYRLFTEAVRNDNWRISAKYARIIVNLPERSET